MTAFGESREQWLDFRHRLLLASAFVMILAMLLGGRLWLLQTRDHQQFAQRADQNRTVAIPVPGVRGLIYDRNGTILADNVPSWQLLVVPESVEDLERTLAAIGEVVPLQTHELQRFHERRQSRKDFHSIPLKLGLTPEELARLEVNRRRWPGVQVQAALTRRYPQGETTAHVVGYVGGISARDLASADAESYRGASYIGKTGLERSFEAELRPTAGQRRMETDARGRLLNELHYSPPTPGWDLRLSLDEQLQSNTLASMQGYRGAAIALDLRQGDVLALVSTPAFDPHLFVNGISHADYARLIDDPGNPLFNRAIQGRYPPGSTVKPLFGLAGLEYGVVHSHDGVYCKGWYQLPNKPRRYRDWKREGHGRVNFRQAIAQSCDIYYYELAYSLGIDRLHDFSARFGLGQLTGIRLPAEESGLLPSRDWKRGHNGDIWYPGETLNVGIGQGYLLMTPMQLAVLTARIASRGQGFAPRLVQSRSRGQEVIENPPQPLPEIDLNNTRHWQQTHDAMVAVVHSPSGTAKSVGRGLPFKVAGKTGTAQVAGLSQEDDEAPQLEDVPYKLRDHALFIAFAPAADPEIAVAVVVENSGSGSAVAAPIAQSMLQDWLMRCDGLRWHPWCLEADI